MPVTKTVKMLVAEAKEQTNSISPADAHDRQQSGDAILIDIRDIRELQRDGRIEGAFHAPRGMLEFWADPDSPYHKEIFATERRACFILRQQLAVSTCCQNPARYGTQQYPRHGWRLYRMENRQPAHHQRRLMLNSEQLLLRQFCKI